MNSVSTNKNEITFFVIATRNYKHYAKQLILSLDRHVRSKFQVIVLTDDPKSFHGIVEEHALGIITAIKIESYGWPDATLRRFELMINSFGSVNGSVVCYLDADTLMLRDTVALDFIACLSSNHQIAAVRHPGYYKRSPVLRLVNSTFLGPWETRRSSSAYIPIQQRKNYVCGGVIFGLTGGFQAMCEEIQQLIVSDSIKGLIAKHNDESYLNAWALRSRINRVSPEWAFAEDYRNLREINPRIQVLHKPVWWTREQ